MGVIPRGGMAGWLFSLIDESNPLLLLLLSCCQAIDVVEDDSILLFIR